jgi:hypothetical protein
MPESPAPGGIFGAETFSILKTLSLQTAGSVALPSNGKPNLSGNWNSWQGSGRAFSIVPGSWRISPRTPTSATGRSRVLAARQKAVTDRKAVHETVAVRALPAGSDFLTE